jgi:tetratricopeptide (TPR) repeat protein
LGEDRLDEAEAAALSALREARDAFGSSSREAARALLHLGAIHIRRGQHDMAEAAQTRALRIVEQHVGLHHPDLCPFLDAIAFGLSGQGRHDEASVFLQRSLTIREALRGPDAPETADALHRLAANYRRQGKYAEAEALGRRVLEIRREALGPDHEDAGESLIFLATLLEMQRKYAEAEPWYREALARNERRWGAESPRTASMAKRLADLLREREEFEEAESLYLRALTIWTDRSGAATPQADAVRKRLESLAAHRNEMPIREKSGKAGAEGRWTASAWKERMARVDRLREAGETARALGAAESAARDARIALGPDDPRLAEAWIRAGRFRRELGDPEGAETAFRQALAILEKARDADPVEISVILDHLAEFHRNQGRFPQAIALRERALDIWIGQFGAEHPAVRSRRERLDALRAEARRAAPFVAVEAPARENPDAGSAVPGPAKPERRRFPEAAARAEAAAAKLAELGKRLDFGGIADAWENHVGFLVRKFSREEWAWIVLGIGFLGFLLTRDWN